MTMPGGWRWCVAAGRGTRAGGGVPKQYRDVPGAPVIRQALALFARPSRDRRGATGDPSAMTRRLSRTRPPD